MTEALAENARARWLEAAAWAQLQASSDAKAARLIEIAKANAEHDLSPMGGYPPASAPSLMPSTDWWADGINWACIAQAETGSDWSAHGPAYSTAFGISTGASEQTPASLSGTASPEEQLAIAIAVERRAGIDAWAEATRWKCGIG